MPTTPLNSLDDMLGMAVTCAKIIAEGKTYLDYDRLKYEVMTESQEWGDTYGGDRANAAVLETYLRTFRESFGMEG